MMAWIWLAMAAFWLVTGFITNKEAPITNCLICLVMAQILALG